MTTAIDPPAHDALFDGEEVPECDKPRKYFDLVIGLMEAWDVSKPEAERRMEAYTLGQCEWLLRRRWGAV